MMVTNIILPLVLTLSSFNTASKSVNSQDKFHKHHHSLLDNIFHRKRKGPGRDRKGQRNHGKHKGRRHGREDSRIHV